LAGIAFAGNPLFAVVAGNEPRGKLFCTKAGCMATKL
jgi:hypothetical protein